MAKKVAKKAVKKMAKKVISVVKKVAPKKLTLGSVKKAFTKSEVYKNVAEAAAITRQQVGLVFAALSSIIDAHLKKGSIGILNIEGLMKIVRKNKPATPARMGKNPFTGETMKYPARPARSVVKIKPLKKIKEMV